MDDPTAGIRNADICRARALAEAWAVADPTAVLLSGARPAGKPAGPASTP